MTEAARALFEIIRRETGHKDDSKERKSTYNFNVEIQGGNVALIGCYGFADPRNPNEVSAYLKAEPKVPGAGIGNLLRLAESFYGQAEHLGYGMLTYRWGGETLTLHISGSSFLTPNEESRKRYLGEKEHMQTGQPDEPSMRRYSVRRSSQPVDVQSVLESR